MHVQLCKYSNEDFVVLWTNSKISFYDGSCVIRVADVHTSISESLINFLCSYIAVENKKSEVETYNVHTK